jgi:hypothetical protein
VVVSHWMPEVRRYGTCQNARVRLGTWNLEGKWSSGHLASLEGWAGIFSSRDLTTQPDPHPATALAQCDGLRLMCPVLPWRLCGAYWEGSAHAEKMSATLSLLREHIDETTIGGGDWNEALESRERPSAHGPVLAVDREVLALGLLATSDGGAT